MDVYKPQHIEIQGDAGATAALNRELIRIANALATVNDMDVLHVEPSRVFVGMRRYFAAGVVGVDEGTYEYTAAGWAKS